MISSLTWKEKPSNFRNLHLLPNQIPFLHIFDSFILPNLPIRIPLIFSAMPDPPDSSNLVTHSSKTSHSDSSTTKTVRVVIKGRVQGVFYRKWTIDNAKELNLNGWVRNLREGYVEALFSGNREAVDKMLKRCSRGPSAAMVTGLDVFSSVEDPGTGFYQRLTA